MRRLALVLATIALAGCGGDSGSSEQPAPAATETATPTPTVDKAADKSVAREAALKLEDFPAGWIEDGGGGEDVDTGCLTYDQATGKATARVDAPRFKTSDKATQVLTSVHLYVDEAAAEDAFGLLTAKQTRQCFAEKISGEVADQEGVEIGVIKHEPLSFDPTGDAVEGGRVTIPFETSGRSLAITLDLAFIRAGRGISLMVFGKLLSPIEATLRDDLVSTSGERLADALA